jgi:hypothetical protein
VNELVKVEPNADVRAYRAATEAAEICKEIVLATSSNIQGRRFVAVEGWQAIAVANGCVLSARDVEKVEGGVRAIGEVRRISDGQVIATGEGFVGEDEPTWFGGQTKNGKTLPRRNDYAIRAMAQTRAMSRAGRTAFAHVVVMMKAGLATTPAEEMVYDGETGEVIETPQKVPGIHKIKERLRTLQADGDKAETLEDFNALVSQHKTDLTTIKDANHEWWSGDGEDFEGFRNYIKRRRDELTPHEDSLAYQLLVSTLNECTSGNELKGWLAKNHQVVEDLDGEESRKFEAIYDAKEAALKLVDTASA